MHLFHLIKRLRAALAIGIVAAVLLCGNALSVQAYTFTPDATIHSQAAILYNRIPNRYSMKKMLTSSRCPVIWCRS